MRRNRHSAFSLVELLAVTSILGLLALIILPRVMGGSDQAKIDACHTNKGDVEIQAELWLHDTGDWPAANLSDVGADVNYFPEGVPSCPVDGTAYTIDPSTGRVIGHNH